MAKKPKYFTQEVIETRTYDVLYVVEAKDEDEAKDKIAIGDTVKETEIKMRDVVGRDGWDEIKPCAAPKEEEESSLFDDKPEITKALVDLLWEHLPKDEKHPDRIRLGEGYGTKTALGLRRTIERILGGN